MTSFSIGSAVVVGVEVSPCSAPLSPLVGLPLGRAPFSSLLVGFTVGRDDGTEDGAPVIAVDGDSVVATGIEVVDRMVGRSLGTVVLPSSLVGLALGRAD